MRSAALRLWPRLKRLDRYRKLGLGCFGALFLALAFDVLLARAFVPLFPIGGFDRRGELRLQFVDLGLSRCGAVAHPIIVAKRIRALGAVVATARRFVAAHAFEVTLEFHDPLAFADAIGTDSS